MNGYWFCRSDMTSPNKPAEKWEVGQKRTLRGGKIVPCTRGFHASPSLWRALTYAPGPVACLVELSGEIISHHDDKMVARSRKLIAAVNIEHDLRLFAADCAEHVLYIFERERHGDDRPRNAIKAARDFANGGIDASAAYAATYDAYDAASAAYAAATAAAAATYDAASAASAAYAAATAAAAATYDAASAASAAYAAATAAAAAAYDAYAYDAYATAYDAAYDDEQAWQRQQFEQRFGRIFDEVQ